MSTDRFSELQLTKNRFWKGFEVSGCVMQPSWAVLAASWRHFGASKAREGAFWSVCEPPWDVVDAPWAPSGRNWRPLGCVYIPTVGFNGGGFRRSPVASAVFPLRRAATLFLMDSVINFVGSVVVFLQILADLGRPLVYFRIMGVV